MGLLLKGKAVFTDCTGSGEAFELLPGDMVFVPVTTRYVSNWYGDVEYISLHFLFEYRSALGKNNNFKLQKVTFEDKQEKIQLFHDILSLFKSGEYRLLGALSRFYGILFEVVPKLECGETKIIDSRILDAVSYIEQHYEDHLTVEKLALEAKMSSSRFFPCFKSALGVTPVDYINHYRVSKAIIMIVNNPEKSIDEISISVGFESTTYFRRVFKIITGKNPREYRKLNAEI